MPKITRTICTRLPLPVVCCFSLPLPTRVDVQEERLVHGKLEGLAYQYNTLLTSQLDEQRHFYQKQVGLGRPSVLSSLLFASSCWPCWYQRSLGVSKSGVTQNDADSSGGEGE